MASQVGNGAGPKAAYAIQSMEVEVSETNSRLG